MKRDTDLGWRLIEQDPMLRLELYTIEQKSPDDGMVEELMEFFERIEGIARLTAALIEENHEIAEAHKYISEFEPVRV